MAGILPVVQDPGGVEGMKRDDGGVKLVGQRGTMPVKVLYIFVLFAYLLAGCNTDSQILLPDCSIQTDHMNNEISIIPNKKYNTYIIGDPIYFFVSEKVDSSIRAPLDFNTRIYKLNSSGDQWEMIKNTAQYYGHDHLLNPDTPIIPFVVDPEKSSSETKATILICVSGEINETTQQEVGAYHIFTLHN